MQQVPPQQQQQQQMGQQPRQPLARSPAPYQQPAGAVFLELTQVIWPGPTQGLNLELDQVLIWCTVFNVSGLSDSLS